MHALCRDLNQFDIMGIMLPVTLRFLDCEEMADDDFPNMASLSRLTRLEGLRMPHHRPFPQPLPRLPALTTFHGNISDLQRLSPVAATLKHLRLSGDTLDFKQPVRFTNFTCLRKLHLAFETYTPLIPNEPQLFPPSLPSISMAWDPDAPLTEFLRAFRQLTIKVSDNDGSFFFTFNPA